MGSFICFTPFYNELIKDICGLYYGIWRMFFLHYFFCFCYESDLSFLPQSPLAGVWVFWGMRGRKSSSEASSCLISGTVLQGFTVLWGSSLSWQIKYSSLFGSVASFAKTEKVSVALLSVNLLEFWRSRSGISASFAAERPSPGQLFFLWTSTSSAKVLCLCCLTLTNLTGLSFKTPLGSKRQIFVARLNVKTHGVYILLLEEFIFLPVLN